MARRAAVSALVCLAVASSLASPPAAAHDFIQPDGNDTLGLLDLSSTSVSHEASSIVHRVDTRVNWRPRDLGQDSYFLFGFDLNNDRDFERCEFIFFYKAACGER